MIQGHHFQIRESNEPIIAFVDRAVVGDLTKLCHDSVMGYFIFGHLDMEKDMCK